MLLCVSHITYKFVSIFWSKILSLNSSNQLDLAIIQKILHYIIYTHTPLAHVSLVVQSASSLPLPHINSVRLAHADVVAEFAAVVPYTHTVLLF